MSSRIKYDVVPWAGGRWRGRVYVDGFPQRKAYFDSKDAATAWCHDVMAELMEEVR